MARPTLRDGVKKILPSWLLGDNSYKYVYSAVIQLDALWDWAEQAIKARFPSTAPDDALPFMGRDRRILRGRAESRASYEERLRQAIPTWKHAGSPEAVLNQLAAYSPIGPILLRYVTTGVDENGTNIADWVTRQLDGTFTYHRANPWNWDWDTTNPGFRFWIIGYTGTLPTWAWGDGSQYGGGRCWGIALPIADIVIDVRNLVDVWKCAGTHAWIDGGIIFAALTTTAPVKWGAPNLNWGGTDPSGPFRYADHYQVGAFDPFNPPGAPMPDGTWGNPANRDPASIYLSGV